MDLADSPLAGNVRIFTDYDPEWEIDPITIKLQDKIGGCRAAPGGGEERPRGGGWGGGRGGARGVRTCTCRWAGWEGQGGAGRGSCRTRERRRGSVLGRR